MLCDSWGLASVEEAYERLEELTKDQEPEMSVDEAEKRFDDYLEYLEEKRDGED